MRKPRGVAIAKRVSRTRRRPSQIIVRAHEPTNPAEEAEAERRWDATLLILARIGRDALA